MNISTTLAGGDIKFTLCTYYVTVSPNTITFIKYEACDEQSIRKCFEEWLSISSNGDQLFSTKNKAPGISLRYQK